MGGNADARIYKVYPCHTSRVVAGVNYFHQREAWEDDISGVAYAVSFNPNRQVIEGQVKCDVFVHGRWVTKHAKRCVKRVCRPAESIYTCDKMVFRDDIVFRTMCKDDLSTDRECLHTVQERLPKRQKVFAHVTMRSVTRQRAFIHRAGAFAKATDGIYTQDDEFCRLTKSIYTRDGSVCHSVGYPGRCAKKVCRTYCTPKQ